MILQDGINIMKDSNMFPSSSSLIFTAFGKGVVHFLHLCKDIEQVSYYL